MSIRLKPNVEKLEKGRKIIFPSMVVGVIVPVVLFYGMDFYYPEKSFELEGFEISSFWMGIATVVYLILGTSGAMYVNNHLRRQSRKLSHEFLEISDDKIYLSRQDVQKSFSISDILNYENFLNSEKSVIGTIINFKDGEKIELLHYDRKEIESVLNGINIPKKNN